MCLKGTLLNCVQSNFALLQGNTVSIKSELLNDKARVSLVEKERATSKKYARAVKELSAVEREFNALLEIKASNKVHAIVPYVGGKKSEATVVVCASDWHVEEEVKAVKVSGLNRYNLDIAKSRAHQFFSRAIKLTQKEQQDIPIRNMVLFLGGDFISGNIHDELLENCLLRPIEAVLFAQELLQSGIEYLLKNSALKLTIVCACGNHGRITAKTHISTEQGNSLEYMMYHSLKTRFTDPRVTFVIGDGYHTYLPIYDKVFRFHHGHAIRYGGGVGGITIPVNKAIAQWNKAHWANRDVFGHYHTYMPLSNFCANGSMIGYNAFALSIKADFERPQQAMFLVDKVRGCTVHMPIIFDQ